MDAEIKRKWVEALRSGEYKQGRNALVGFSYEENKLYLCCIGVGFCIVRPSEDVNGSDTDTASAVLGLAAEQQDTLVNMNDEKKMSFAEIADYIEGYL